MAEVCKWSKRANLIHLTTKSCSAQQKGDYDLLVADLTRRFTAVRIQSVQTSLFHDRKQKVKESVDSYAQDLKALFPQTQEGSVAAESMGQSVLSSQLEAGPNPALKPKVASLEGDFELLLVKARFEEAKLKEFSSATQRRVTVAPLQNKPAAGNRAATALWVGGLRCDVCGSTQHLKRRCPYSHRGAPGELRGRLRPEQQVSAVVPALSTNKQGQDEMMC